MPRSIAPVLTAMIILSTALLLDSAWSDAHITRHHIPYFLSTNHDSLHSVIRLTWASCSSKPNFLIRAYDDSGVFRGMLDIPWSEGPRGCGEIVEFNSDDLENGNLDKGIIGIGQGEGDWQLFIEADAPYVSVSSYVSTEDGFLITMHDTVPFYDYRDSYHVTTFNFADAVHESRLRIINPNDTPIFVSIMGQWDTLVGSYDHGQWIPMEPHQVLTLTAEDLETYNPEWHVYHPGVGRVPGEGVIGEPFEVQPGEEPPHAWTPMGQWRLYIQGWDADSQKGNQYEIVPLIVMNLMEDAATGLLANLSTRPDTSTTIVRDTEPVADNFAENFDLDFVFADDVPSSVRSSFQRAAYRWESVVVGDLMAENVSIARGECGGSQGYIGEVDDLLVFVSMGYLGGRSGPVGRANVCRSSIRGNHDALLPVAGWVLINRDARNSWNSVTESFDAIVTHEIGHALGFTTSILGASGYLRYYPTRHFAGPLARQAFIDQGGETYTGAFVPMADGSHWHDDTLSGEIMAPSIAKSSVISHITVQALADLGYEVDLSAAEF